MMADEDLKIARVDLPDQSKGTYRALHGVTSIKYPVVLWFSRPVDDFERRELKGSGISVDEDNPSRGRIGETTLEEVRRLINVFNGKLEMAARDARPERERAEAEDDRLITLLSEINAGLAPTDS
jgi:hypothetical protein